jgi:hypothetical protein
MKLAQLISNFSFIKILTANKSTVHVAYLVKCRDLGSLYFLLLRNSLCNLFLVVIVWSLESGYMPGGAVCELGCRYSSCFCIDLLS